MLCQTSRIKLTFPVVMEDRLFQPKSAPFEDQPMGVQLVMSRTPRIAVQLLGQVGTQCSIAVKKRDPQLNNIFEKEIKLFT